MFYFLIPLVSYNFSLYLDNVYIGDQHNNRIRKVTISTGIITTIAGSSTSGSYSGDNGPATSAAFNQPLGVAVDVSGTHSSHLLIVNQYFLFIFTR